jgi:hypothetical protein
MTKAASTNSNVTIATGHILDRQSEALSYVTRNTSQTITPNRHTYALHILNNKHEYGPMHNTMEILKQINQTKFLIPYEQLHIQSHHITNN